MKRDQESSQSSHEFAGVVLDQSVVSAIKDLPMQIRNHVAIVALPDFRLLFLNPAGEKLLKLESLVPGDRCWTEFLVDGDGKDRFLSSFQSSSKVEDWRGEVVLSREDGSTCPAMLLAFANQADESSIQTVTIICRDLTAAKEEEAARRLMELRLGLARKMETVGRLTASVSHELNTPLQSLTYDLDFVRSTFDSLCEALDHQHLQNGKSLGLEGDDLEELKSEVKDTFDQSVQCLRTISGIVAALKSFALSGEVEARSADLNKMITATVLFSRQEWLGVAEVVTNLDETLPLVECRIDQINYALLNLLVNAVRAVSLNSLRSTSGVGRVEISTRPLDQGVCIQIKDNGIGMPPRVVERIFDPTYTTKKDSPGAGEGLAIVRSTVEVDHGGKIEIESEEGRGSNFRIWLPLRQSTKST